MRIAFGVLASAGITAAMLITASPQSTVVGATGVPRQVLLRPDSGNGNGDSQGQPRGRPELADQVYGLTNNERAKAGCPKLRRDQALDAAAVNHSRDMATYGYLSHTNSNDEGADTRMERAGYDTSKGWAENIAAGP